MNEDMFRLLRDSLVFHFPTSVIVLKNQVEVEDGPLSVVAYDTGEVRMVNYGTGPISLTRDLIKAIALIDAVMA